MGYHFLPWERDQLYLMPPALEAWLPEGALAWFVLDAVAQMDLAKIERAYRADGGGSAAAAPAMRVALLLYADCLGERSSRRIDRLCERDVAVRVLTANQGPDHTTRARFRQIHETELATLFTPVLHLCAEAGLVQVGVVALDGTKVTANAAVAAKRTAETIEPVVTTMLADAHTVDDAEDRLDEPDQRGDALPEAWRDRTRRLKRLQACQARQAEEPATGQKKRGRKPKAPEAAADATAKANVTDPESRTMKTPRGYVHGSNAQAMVTEEQIIVAAEVTQDEHDINQLPPMLEAAQAQLCQGSSKFPQFGSSKIPHLG